MVAGGAFDEDVDGDEVRVVGLGAGVEAGRSGSPTDCAPAAVAGGAAVAAAGGGGGTRNSRSA